MIHTSQATVQKAAIITAAVAIKVKILIIAAFCQVCRGASCVKPL